MVAELLLYALLDVLLLIICWGIAGYLLFRILGVSEEKSHYDFAIVCLICITTDYWFQTLLYKLDIVIGNQEFLEIFGEDTEWLFEFGWFDVISDVAIIYAGYFIGQRIWRRYKRRTAAEVSAS